ncbi:hypothetical protein RFI_16953, partial [Reticulomyxa filosa]
MNVLHRHILSQLLHGQDKLHFELINTKFFAFVEIQIVSKIHFHFFLFFAFLLSAQKKQIKELIHALKEKNLKRIMFKASKKKAFLESLFEKKFASINTKKKGMTTEEGKTTGETTEEKKEDSVENFLRKHNVKNDVETAKTLTLIG